MKKFFRAIALLLVIGVISTPVSAFAATIERVEDYGMGKSIYYSPNDLLIINSGSLNRLENTDGGNWCFQPGKMAQVGIRLIMPADFNVMLYKVNSGKVASYTYENCINVVSGFEWCIQQSGEYIIIIEPLNGTTVIVDNFYVYYN